MTDIKGIIFDFDGLVIDSETCKFSSWQEAFREYGAEISLDEWIVTLGTHEHGFHPTDLLKQRCGVEVDDAVLHRNVQKRADAKIHAMSPYPGVETLLHEARAAGLIVAMASSSKKEWVTGHLKYMKLFDLFDFIVCGDEVPAVKPDPGVYNLVLRQMGLDNRQAFALEDSPNGIAAAKAAGLFCFAIPNVISVGMDTSRADYSLSSLAQANLNELIGVIEKNHLKHERTRVYLS
jgi:HAD superfamily hydrolase (TIGR01509 family)